MSGSAGNLKTLHKKCLDFVADLACRGAVVAIDDIANESPAVFCNGCMSRRLRARRAVTAVHRDKGSFNFFANLKIGHNFRGPAKRSATALRN